MALRDAVPVEGLKATIKGHSLLDVAREVLAISKKGLSARGQKNRDGYDESHFLSSIEEVVARGTSLSEELLRAYHTRFDGSVEPVFSEFAF